MRNFSRCLAILFSLLVIQAGLSQDDLQVLFLGDNGHHQPKARFAQLEPVLADRGIALTYADDPNAMSSENLANYKGLIVYANIDIISESQEKALLEYVENGGGFIPLHCASFCFRNSKEVVALIGAQFKRHGGEIFRTEITESDHPIMKGFGGFDSWDETYVHHMHDETNRTVLSYRVDKEGREPWTWIKTYGDGRVFYTAWGHDHRTWRNPGFVNLVERGIRWAVKSDPQIAGAFTAAASFPKPKMTEIPKDLKPFSYKDVGKKIPNYPPSNRWGVQLESLSKMQEPLPADEAIKHISTPSELQVEVFASDPELGGKPVAMAWDERGRLWVCETYDYPNELQPAGKGRDRIRICEDTDGDWIADKFTVFAEKLSIPTSIAFHKGGIFVQDGTRTLYLKDTDGDDVADIRKTVVTGWQLGDTHGGVSNFQYGLDNHIWAMQGYNSSTPNANGKKQQNFRQGFFRFDPNSLDFEFIRSTDNNTWGLGISEEGIIFGSTANRCPSVYMPIANRYYEKVRGWKKSLTIHSMADNHLFEPVTKAVRQMDHHGGYTAGAGHALYTARNYPQKYWNRTAFVNGPTGHLVGGFLLTPDGSDFRSVSEFNLFASDDEWSAPIMSEVGPDGNMWVLDWYNYIVQHNPTPRGFKTGKGNAYVTDLRDKRHGRVYRLTPRDKESQKPFTLKGASFTKLVDTLKNPTQLWRKHAQRLLVEAKATEVIPQLIKLIEDPSTDEIGLNVGAIHALWTLKGIGALDGSHEKANAAVAKALSHPSAGVRRNALQVLPNSKSSTAAVLAANLLKDRDAQVRLAAFLALSDLPESNESGKAISDSIVHPLNAFDRWIPDAATSAAANNAVGFLGSFSSVEEPKKPQQNQLEIAQIVAEHFARSKPESVDALVASMLDAHPSTSSAILKGLDAGWSASHKIKLSNELEGNLQTLVEKLPVSDRGLLLKLASSWGSKKLEKYAAVIIEDLLEQINNEDASVKARLAAANKLINFQPASNEVFASVLGSITAQATPELASGIIESLRGSEASEAGAQLIEAFATLTPRSQEVALKVLMARKNTTIEMLDAMTKGTLQLTDLKLDQRQTLASHPDKTIREKTTKLLEMGGALPNADRQKVLDALLSTAEEKGDVVAGKLVFKNACAKCHKHSGEGEEIGPELTGMAVHPKEELLVHILDPNRSVESNFRMYNVTTFEGLTFNGMLTSESKTAIEIADTEGKKKTVLREDIEEIVAQRTSIMPVGFEKELKRQQFVDLLEFLTDRGQFLTLDISKAANTISDRGMFFTKEGQTERMIFPDWKPKMFKKVPFELIDPNDGKVPNLIMLYGPNGPMCAKMPKKAELPIGGPVKTVHMLSGVSGWGFPYGPKGGVVVTVRFHYKDGKTEDHDLINGEHFADYIRRTEVPKSEFAFQLRGQQLRYLSINAKRSEPIEKMELIKGKHYSAPMVMAITLEAPADSGKH